MATAEEYAGWIVKNQDKRGTPEFDTVAQAYKMARSAAKPKEVAPDPTEGNSWLQNARTGMGQAFANIGRGIGQAVGMVSQEEIDEAKRLDAPLDKARGSTIGNIAGNVAALAPTLLIPGANTITGAALYGGLASALTTPGDFSTRAYSGAVGAAGGAAGQAIPRVVSALRAGAEPLTEAGRSAIAGRVMNKAAGESAPSVAARLRGATELVPGSAPTAAEVGESGGIAALQRAMSAADPESYAHRGMQQNAARVAALRNIAGDESKMAAAIAAREGAAAPLYTSAKAAVVKGDKELDAILGRPVMKEAWAKAQELAANRGEKITLSAKPAGTIAATDASGAPILQEIPAKAAEYSGNGLHYLKLALDDMLDASPATALGRNQKAAVTQNKEQLLKWLETNIPDYGKASAAYAAGSKPINQMLIGQELVEKLSPALADNGALAKETAAKYAQALRNGDQTAKSATGFRQGIEQVMEPGQMQALQGVAQDLGRKANAQDLGRGVGSNTYQNFAMDNLAESMGVPSAVKSLGGMIPGMSPTMTMLSKGAQAVGGMAYKNSDELIRQKMAQALLNPKVAADLMDKASQPTALAAALRKLPQLKSIPPEEMLRVLQAMPGVAGAGAVPVLANARQ